MVLLDISLQARVIIGISAMVILFASFLVSFIGNQRKKLQYHKDLRDIQDRQQQELKEQNLRLEDRVRERTLELSQQKDTLQSTLADLRASQQLLVQREKMASLGEIASGIAHEIQNPLNFVNNFAEINTELLAEIQELLAAEKASMDNKGEMNLLMEDVISNLKKIHQHGKRADSIVKSMLEHSRSGAGHQEPTNINTLAEECLRLAYHGQRSKEGAVDVTFQTELEKSLGDINVVPQEISRVLLNLLNNAFYAVAKKRSVLGEGFQPTIFVSTHRNGNMAEIHLKDNGMGIPEGIRSKIFQPFFTTKPTGEGTGLGLSLSYEIVKAHGGELKASSVEGEYSEFTILLPIGK
jgi:two-component system NtrC family sensor kinase